MGEWQSTTLESIADVNPRESLSKGTVAKKVAMEQLLPFNKRVSGFEETEFKGGTKFRNGDTLVARITPCLENGKTAYVDFLADDEVAFGSTEYIVLREKAGESDSGFLYYFTISPEFRDIAILSMTGSSGRQRVQTDVVSNHVFKFPKLKEQQAIAEVLSSLDDKIDLLQRQNKTLEAMAEALFRHTFIDNAQDDWETVVLGDLVETNVSNVNSEYPFENILYLDTGSLTKGTIEGYQALKRADAPSRAKRLVAHNDILISTVRPNQKHYGIVKNPPDNLVVSTGFCVLKATEIDPHLLYIYLTTEEMTEKLHVIAEASTSAYPSLKPSDIEALEFTMPSGDLLNEISSIAAANWDKIEQNNSEIETLAALRDALLPKLMSGEVHVAHKEGAA